MSVILVRYAEIALKGSNRYVFERQLQKNIHKTLRIPLSKIQQHQTQFAIDASPAEERILLERLGKVFGVAWYTPTRICESTFNEIIHTCLEVAKENIKPGQTFAIRSQRSDKSLPFASHEVEHEAGAAVQEATGAAVDLGNPDVTIYVSASMEGSYIYTEKIPGPGGLPVGTSGKVLSLLSGGPDSIAGSYYLARRGAEVDFLHFHVFPDKSQVENSKIADIARKLSSWTLSNHLILSSYLPFDMRIVELNQPDARYELVVFRRLMVRVAEALANLQGYQAIVLGDSLGQVASQTMENIIAVDDAVTIPVFRPLIGMDKVKIIDLVQKIGLYEEAIAPYKDCCSIIAPNPVTKAYLPRVRALEKKLQILQVVEEMVEVVEKVEVGK